MCKFCKKIQKLSISENEVLVVKIPKDEFTIQEVCNMAEDIRKVTDKGIILIDGIKIEVELIDNVIKYLEELKND